MTAPLSGRRILLIEDQYLLAQDLARALRSLDAEITGHAATVSLALALLDETADTDGAVIDVNLQRQDAHPVAEALPHRDIPFVFASGYDPCNIPPGYDSILRCEKPVSAAQMAEAIFPPLLDAGDE